MIPPKPASLLRQWAFWIFIYRLWLGLAFLIILVIEPLAFIKNINQLDLSLIFFGFVHYPIILWGTTLLINKFPDLKVKHDGIEISFLPLISLHFFWLKVPWRLLSRTEEINLFSHGKMLRVVFSSDAPLFYKLFYPPLLFLDSGGEFTFLIHHSTDHYDWLVETIKQRVGQPQKSSS